MTREEKVKNLLTELIDMIDNGSQRDLDRADEIGTSIIELLEQEPMRDATPEERESVDEYIKSISEPTGVYFWEEQEPILDKIRAEIDSHCSDNRDRNDGLYIAMKIIDKYRKEGVI